MWLVWLALALVLGTLELASGDFVLLMIAGGAVVAAGSAGLDLPLFVQAIVFALSSAIMLFVVRPPLKRMMSRHPHTLTGVAALSGRQAEALTEITDRSGTVKLAGEVWTARAAEHGASIEPGATVTVETIDGATAVVRAVGDGARELHREPPASE
jgi:membrane protein implicated in regulation of membrane protease activity